jgi:hypothetical protein
MARSVSWIEVLNEETTWRVSADMARWLNQTFGRDLRLSDSELETFEQSLDEMRHTIDAIHFNEKVSWQWLDESLGRVRLTARREQLAASVDLPLVHARLEGVSDDDLLCCFRQTLLVQFSHFISDMIEKRDAPSIARCVGVFRENNNSALSIVRSISDESERRWRSEIELLGESDLLDTPTVQRCADIFIATPKAKFCSDACRFTTFQMAKQFRDPRYHAAKQKKYRDKSSRAQGEGSRENA